MNKKAQILMISLWILVMLTVLAVGIGHRVSLALKLSGYQRDKVKAFSLAKAGVNRAIVELDKDVNEYDALNESWADNKEVFEIILPDESKKEYATVSYIIKDKDTEETKFGVVDEECKININTAPKELLAELFSRIGAANPEDVGNNICAWRGDADCSIPEYTGLGYSNKGSKFINTEELILVKGMDPEIYVKARDFITVCGSGRVNLNTVSQEILGILIGYCRRQLENSNVEERDPEDLENRIIDLRLKGLISKSFSELETNLGDIAAHSGPRNILNQLSAVAGFKSSCFYIVSNGKIRDKVFFTIRCIYDRGVKKTAYWHES
jgi:type II secretory pathway component PulK